MIYVDAERCTGCDECVNVCPTGAIALQNGKAHIAENLCRECEVCRQVCPQDAILAVDILEPAPRKPARQPTAPPHEVIRIAPRSRAITLREVALPAVGSALLWFGREVIPRLAHLALNALEQRSQTSPSSPALAPRGIGRQCGKRSRRGRRGRNAG